MARVDAAVNGVPARVLPIDVWHTASVGIDLWLAAIAFGAVQVWVLMSDEEAPAYREAVAQQMQVAQSILSGLGFAGEHLRIVQAGDARALDAALRHAPAQGVGNVASFNVPADKRATLELAIDHLVSDAEAVPDEIELPPRGSPFGSLRVDAARCTLCLACVGACPQAALADNPDRPQLRFIEKNCVQCGLCALTCPEDAIVLQPRLLLADAGKSRRQARVLNEVEPYLCIRCRKPFGTLKAIETMMARLAGHSMFQGAAAERLKMCGDCRVIDLHTRDDEVRITDIR
jgi:ferredoxin